MSRTVAETSSVVVMEVASGETSSRAGLTAVVMGAASTTVATSTTAVAVEDTITSVAGVDSSRDRLGIHLML